MCDLCALAGREVIKEIVRDTVDEGEFDYDPYYDDPMDPTDAEDRW